jgi:hypothetical protein
MKRTCIELLNDLGANGHVNLKLEMVLIAHCGEVSLRTHKALRLLRAGSRAARRS